MLLRPSLYNQFEISFHNTINNDESEQKEANVKAKSQEDMVLEIMNKVKSGAWFEIASYLPDMDHCSLKRSLSNLQDKGLLVKDTQKANMVMGPKGKPCHRYYLRSKI